MLTSSKINGMAYDEKTDPESGFHRGFACAVDMIVRSLERSALDDSHRFPNRSAFMIKQANIIKSTFANKHIVKHFRLKSPSFRRKQFYVIEGGKDEVHGS